MQSGTSRHVAELDAWQVMTNDVVAIKSDDMANSQEMMWQQALVDAIFHILRGNFFFKES